MLCIFSCRQSLPSSNAATDDTLLQHLSTAGVVLRPDRTLWSPFHYSWIPCLCQWHRRGTGNSVIKNAHLGPLLYSQASFGELSLTHIVHTRIGGSIVVDVGLCYISCCLYHFRLVLIKEELTWKAWTQLQHTGAYYIGKHKFDEKLVWLLGFKHSKCQF